MPLEWRAKEGCGISVMLNVCAQRAKTIPRAGRQVPSSCVEGGKEATWPQPGLGGNWGLIQPRGGGGGMAQPLIRPWGGGDMAWPQSSCRWDGGIAWL